MDENIRYLERIAAESGDVDDESKVIVAKIRAGIIPERYVLLSAYLGNSAAIMVMWSGYKKDLLRCWTESEFFGIDNYLEDNCDKDIMLSCSIDFVEHVLPIFEKSYPNDLRIEVAIQAFKDGLTPNCSYIPGEIDDLSAYCVAVSASKIGSSIMTVAAYARAARSTKEDKGAKLEGYWQCTRLCDYLLGYRSTY